jgi:hypothetical protein
MPTSPLLTRFTYSLGLVIMLTGFAVIALAHALPEGHWLRLFVTEIGIAGASAGIVGFVYEHLLRRALLAEVTDELVRVVNADAQRLGIAEIYESRVEKAERIKLSHLIEEARTEIMFVGLGLATIITQYGNHLEKAIARGCAVRFLAFNVPGPSAQWLAASLTGGGKLPEDLNEAFETVSAFSAEHEPSGKVDFRTYNIIPTFGCIAFDRADGNGFLLIELNCYLSSGDQCPGFKLEKRPKGLFYNYNRQIDELWKRATVFDPAIQSAAVPGQGA